MPYSHQVYEALSTPSISMPSAGPTNDRHPLTSLSNTHKKRGYKDKITFSINSLLLFWPVLLFPKNKVTRLMEISY